MQTPNEDRHKFGPLVSIRKLKNRSGVRVSVSVTTVFEKCIIKNLKSPQGDGKSGRKSQNLGRFSELFRQNRLLDGF